MGITAPTSWAVGTLKWENSPNVVSMGVTYSSAECQLPVLLMSEWTPCTLHSRYFGLISYSSCCCSKTLSVAPNRCTQMQLDITFNVDPCPGLTTHLRLLCSCHSEILDTLVQPESTWWGYPIIMVWLKLHPSKRCNEVLTHCDIEIYVLPFLSTQLLKLLQSSKS